MAVGNDAILNQGTGTIAVNSGTLSGITTLTNTSSSAAAIDVASGATLSFGSLQSSAGTVTVSGTAIVVGPGLLDNQLGSTFDLNGAVTGSVNNAGTATIAGTVSGQIINALGGVCLLYTSDAADE